MSVQRGTRLIVFDSISWGGHDKGDNECFWKPATVECVYQLPGLRELVVDVRFDHRPEPISEGHFLSATRGLPFTKLPVGEGVARGPDCATGRMVPVQYRDLLVACGRGRTRKSASAPIGDRAPRLPRKDEHESDYKRRIKRKKVKLVMLADGGAYARGHIDFGDFARMILRAEGADGCSVADEILEARLRRIISHCYYALCRIRPATKNEEFAWWLIDSGVKPGRGAFEATVWCDE